MNKAEPNQIFSYGVAVFTALLIHGGLLFWLSMDFQSAKSKSLMQPKAIQASLISASAASKKTHVKPKPRSKPKLKPKPKPKAKPKAEPKPKPNPKPSPQPAPREMAEPEPQAVPSNIVDDELERELLDELASFETAIAAAQAAEDQATAMSYMGLIQQSVEVNWSRPPSARNGMQAMLQIELIPDGTIVNVNIISSSGNQAFDRSAVTAVNKSERFPELAELEPRIFERYYRQFKLLFKPEDLRL